MTPPLGRDSSLETFQRSDEPAGERRLRVAMVVGGFPNAAQPSRGIFTLRAAQALAQLTDLMVVFLRTWKPGRRVVEVSEYAGVPVTALAVPQLPGDPPICETVYRWLGGQLVHLLLQTCDIVHSVDALNGVLASAWARRARIHHVTQLITHHVGRVPGGDVHPILPPSRAERDTRGWERYLHGVACNSRALESAFLAVYPGSRNVRTVWHGVDLECFHPLGPKAGPLADQPAVRYLFLGGFPAYPSLPHRANTKGGETLLATWQAAEEELIPTGASLAIAGPESEVDRVARWRSGLRRPDRVHLSGTLKPEMVPAYIRSSDVVLLPSMQEGLPYVAMEASACGRPVFGSDIGGISDVVAPGKTGLLLPPGDVTAWKHALVAYASRASSLRVMGEQARQRMEALFDCRDYGRKMLDLYRVALREPLHPGPGEP
jgi:glycosyltransferase involved in cell wall biosynthesis